MKNNRYNTLIIVVLILISCNGCSKKLKFKLPNGEIIEQSTIQVLEKRNKVRYEQYVGFTLIYQDSLFTRDSIYTYPILVLPYSGVIQSDVISGDQINKLKLKQFESIVLRHRVTGNLNKRDLEFEKIIKQTYKDFDEELPSQEGFELRKKGEKYVDVLFYSGDGSSYIITIFPYE